MIGHIMDIRARFLQDRGLRTVVLASLAVVGVLNLFQLGRAILAAPDRFSQRAPLSDKTGAPVQAAAPDRLPGDGTGRLEALTSIAAPAVTTADGEAAALRLSAAGLKSDFANLYIQAARATGTPWQLLAAVHWAETRQSGSTNRSSYAGATGPMQFLPATFAHYGVDGDGNGKKDIHNVTDAMFSAGRYLSVSGAANGRYRSALLVYNHSNTYASSVLATATKLGL